MGLSLLIFAVCAIFGAVAVLATRVPLPDGENIRQTIRKVEPKRFSPTRTFHGHSGDKKVKKAGA